MKRLICGIGWGLLLAAEAALLCRDITACRIAGHDTDWRTCPTTGDQVCQCRRCGLEVARQLAPRNRAIVYDDRADAEGWTSGPLSDVLDGPPSPDEL